MGFHGMGGGMAAYAEEQKKRGRKTDTRTLRRVAQAFSPYKFQVVLVLVAIILTTVLGLVNPLLIRYVFDDAIGKGNLKLLIILVIIRASPYLSLDHLQSGKRQASDEQGDAAKYGYADREDAGNALSERHSADKNIWPPEICGGSVQRREPEVS